MTEPSLLVPGPAFDLVIGRTIDVPPELVWEAWTKPEHLERWFTPAPWWIEDCEVDLRPGGIFSVVMRGPEGDESVISGCYLDIVPIKRLVWTDALLTGFRPTENPFVTGIITMEQSGAGTKYRAMARHRDSATSDEHKEMGFFEG